MKNEDVQLFTQKNLPDFLNLFFNSETKNPSILLVNKGKLMINNSHKLIELRHHTVHFMHSADSCKILDSSFDLDFKIIHFDRTILSNMNFQFNKYDISNYILRDEIFPLNSSEEDFIQLWQLSTVLENVLNRKTINRTIVQHLLMACVYALLDILSSVAHIGKGSRGRKEEIVMRFLYLIHHYKPERNVLFYADKMSLSAGHLCTSIKEFTGKSPKQLIERLIFKEAKNLVCGTELQINEIAHQLQFKDSYHFSNFFKKHSGLSPTAYRVKNSIP